MKSFDLLNEKQKEAATYIDGPLLIIAGPGSGKTRTLVERVSYILNNTDTEPQNILLATFTEKASRELITRVSENISGDINLSEMYIGTIHSICLRIIDENIEKSVLKRNYKVLEPLEQRFFIYTKLKKFEEVEGFEKFFHGMNAANRWKKAGILQKWIDKINEERLDNKNITESRNSRVIFLNRIHEIYRVLLFQENSIDFSNIQLECYRLLIENPDILKNIHEKIKYLMIDEYQDTNSIQERIFLLIAGERKNICVVGDDDQGIYRFRGATIRNILQFQKNFRDGECRKIELDVNYRSNEDIVNFCNKWNSLLKWDGWRYPKNIVSGKEGINNTLGVIKISEKTESRWEEKLFRFIRHLKKIGKISDYNQVAFLFRSVRNYRSLRLMEALEARGIPVYSPRSNMFFKREEIHFVIGLLIKILPQTEEFIFGKSYGVEGYYRECLMAAEKNLKEDEELKKYIDSFKVREILPNFLSLFYEIISFPCDSFKKYFNFSENHILKNRGAYNFGIMSQILEKFDNLCSVESITEKNSEKLINYFFNIHLKFLIDSGVGEYENMREYAPEGAVSFLTIHQGKGLEFPCVIVGYLDELPNVDKDNEAQKQLELVFSQNFEPEYRIKEFDFWRMYYTAFSRAQNLLALTCIENSYKPVPSIPFRPIYEDLKDAVDGDFEFHKLGFEEIKKINIKEIFAFTSHISLYKLCPLLYKIQKKYEFVFPKNIGMIFGILVHETLEEINRDIFNGKIISNEIILQKFKENYFNLKRNYKINLDEEVLKSGEKYICDYYGNSSEIYSNIKDIEIKISFVKEKYILEGTADLVIEKNGELEIIDFKTGKRKQSSEEVYINQLEIYAYLLGKKYGRKIQRGKIYYLGENDSKKITEVIFTEENLKRAIDDFNSVAEKILAENYETKFDLEKEKCASCIFAAYCKNENRI